MTKEKKIYEIVIPKGERPEDYLDIDDGSYNEEPIAQKEVEIRYE